MTRRPEIEMNHVLGGGPVPRWSFTEMEMDHVLGIVPGPSWLLWGRFPGQIQSDFIAVRLRVGGFRTHVQDSLLGCQQIGRVPTEKVSN